MAVKRDIDDGSKQAKANISFGLVLPAQHVRMGKAGSTHSMFAWVRRDGTGKCTLLNQIAFVFCECRVVAVCLPPCTWDCRLRRGTMHTVRSDSMFWWSLSPCVYMHMRIRVSSLCGSASGFGKLEKGQQQTWETYASPNALILFQKKKTREKQKHM